MASNGTSVIYLGDYESLETSYSGIDYIRFRRTHHKEPDRGYRQLDEYPLPPAKGDARTFISPRTVAIPTRFYDGGRKLWKFVEAHGIWTRGSAIWEPKFVLRVFSQDGRYINQIHFGKSWRKFDRLVAKFNPNDEQMVFQYNMWRYNILAEHQTDFSEEEPEPPWNAKERIILRGYVNDYIEERD